MRIAPGSRAAGILGEEARIKSTHHQAPDRIGDGLEPVGWAEDGTVEALERPGGAFAVGVLWHPEAGEDKRLFEALVEEARTYRAARSLTAFRRRSRHDGCGTPPPAVRRRSGRRLASRKHQNPFRGTRKIGSPSRWRFHPPLPLAFRLGLAAFPVQPSEAASTYSRSVLGALATLREDGRPHKTPRTGKCAKSGNFVPPAAFAATVRPGTAIGRPVRLSFSFLLRAFRVGHLGHESRSRTTICPSSRSARSASVPKLRTRSSSAASPPPSRSRRSSSRTRSPASTCSPRRRPARARPSPSACRSSSAPRRPTGCRRS